MTRTKTEHGSQLRTRTTTQQGHHGRRGKGAIGGKGSLDTLPLGLYDLFSSLEYFPFGLINCFWVPWGFMGGGRGHWGGGVFLTLTPRELGDHGHRKNMETLLTIKITLYR